MTDALSIAVVGAGAIGSAVAFSLARAGFAPKLVARGATLAAIRRDGLRVDKWNGGDVVQILAGIGAEAHADATSDHLWELRRCGHA